MGFFSKKQKDFSCKNAYYDILKGYKESEKKLERASEMGDNKALKVAMEEHQCYEYALLYRNTPEYKRRKKR